MTGRLLVPDKPKTAVDVAETLEELHQVVTVATLDTSGKDASALKQVHPIGWVSIGVLVLAVIFHIKGSNWLIGNLALWHWVALIAIAAVSVRPAWIKAVSLFIDRVTDFFDDGANSFGSPRAGAITILVALSLAGLMIGPLVGLADWIFGVEVTPISTSEFEVTSSNAGWVRTPIAAIVVFGALFALYRALSARFGDAEISIRSGALLGVVVFAVTFLVVTFTSGWETGITAAFALGILASCVALGPLWVMAWGIFIVIFFYVVTRYTARPLSANIIVGEVSSLGLQMFALVALLGVGYGVKAGVNPRIDFWWTDFTNRQKAWLDFVLHTFLLVPFLFTALRLLHGYAKTNLGFKRSFSGETNGEWPASWHVWETWSQAPDAGNLPVGPIRLMIFVGFVFFLAQVISEIIKWGFVLIRREDLAELKAVDAPARVE